VNSGDSRQCSVSPVSSDFENYFVDGGLAMKLKKDLGIPMLALAVLALFAATYAYADSQDKLSPYEQIATVNVPSGFVFPGGGFDIVWADSSTNRVYIADRGNATASPPVPPGVDVLSTKHPNFLFEIPLPNSGGTNGVLVFHNSGDDNDQGDNNGLGTLVWAEPTAIRILLICPVLSPRPSR
jgi:hypothetical protein